MKKKNQEIPYQEMFYSNRNAHNTIISLKDHLDGFNSKGKDYEDMLNYMVDNYDYYDEDESLGRPSEVQKALGYSYSKFKRILKLLFNDLQEYLAGSMEYWQKPNCGIQIDKITVVYKFKNQGEVLSIINRNVSYLPRVGDTIWMYNLFPLIGSGIFVVDHISHHIENKEQIVGIHCSYNYENGFSAWSKDIKRRW